MTADKRRGFTLGEVLATIALVAVLAAVTFPTIASQLAKGDPARAWGDLVSLRDAISSFTTDVGKYPAKISQLTSPIVSSSSLSDSYLLAACDRANPSLCAKYGSADVLRWHGPYLNKDAAAVQSTGFGLTIDAAFTGASMPSSGFDVAAGNTSYVVVTVPNVDTLQWLAIDQAYDDGVALTGTVRYRSTGANAKTLKYLALPIQ